MGWRLDIVSLLAVIGESSMEVHAQRTTASWLCILPRLIPAPQGLLKADRPKRLPQVPGMEIYGVFSATNFRGLNFAANLIHKVENLKKHEFQEWTIDYDNAEPRTTTKPFNALREKAHDLKKKALGDIETGKGNVAALDLKKPVVLKTGLEVTWRSPANILTLASFLGTVGLFIWACILQDGVAALSIGLLSLTASLTGLARKWKPELGERQTANAVPHGDIVIKTPEGAVIVVHCHENIARALYNSVDQCDYRVERDHARILVAFGTLFLMIAVVLLGNCTWTMQAAIGAAYLILNGAYWLASLLSEDWYWKLKGIVTTDLKKEPGKVQYSDVKDGVKQFCQMPEKMTRAERVEKDGEEKGVDMTKFRDERPEDVPSYTRTLWYAIHRSKSASWVSPGEAAPNSAAWVEWVDEAWANVEDPDWKAVTHKNLVFKSKPSDSSYYGAPTRSACKCGQKASTTPPASTPLLAGTSEDTSTLHTPSTTHPSSTRDSSSTTYSSDAAAGADNTAVKDAVIS